MKLLLQYNACPSVINGSAQIPKDVTHDEEIRSMLEGMPTHIILLFVSFLRQSFARNIVETW